MALTNSYLQGVYETVQKRNPNEPEFQQAVYEVLESLQPVVEARPELEKNGIMERIVEPERIAHEERVDEQAFVCSLVSDELVDGSGNSIVVGLVILDDTTCNGTVESVEHFYVSTGMP